MNPAAFLVLAICVPRPAWAGLVSESGVQAASVRAAPTRGYVQVLGDMSRELLLSLEAGQTSLRGEDLPALVVGAPTSVAERTAAPSMAPEPMAAALALERILEDPAAALVLSQQLGDPSIDDGHLPDTIDSLIRVARRADEVRASETGPAVLERLSRGLKAARGGLDEGALDDLFDRIGLRLKDGLPLPSPGASVPDSPLAVRPAEEARLRRAQEDYERVVRLVEASDIHLNHQRALLRAAEQDIFTGFYSRDALERHARAGDFARDGRDALLLDIDNFGLFNALLGPRRTDRIIARFGNLIYAFIRDMDRQHRTAGRIYRLGGEEILILATRGSGRDLAQAVREYVEKEFLDTLLREGFVTSEEVGLLRAAAVRRNGSSDATVATVSIGLTHIPRFEVPIPRQNRQALSLALARADRALMFAKAAGRNRVAVFGGIDMEELPSRAGAIPARFADYQRNSYTERTAVEAVVKQIHDALRAVEGKASVLVPHLGGLPGGPRDFVARVIGADNMAPSLLSRKGLLIYADRAYSEFDAMAVLEIVGFKDVNDAAGHAAGDDVLRHHGERLAKIAQDMGLELGRDLVIARRLGKEFGVLGRGPQLEKFLKAVDSVALADALPDSAQRQDIERHMADRFAREGRRVVRPAGSFRHVSRPISELRPAPPPDAVTALEEDMDYLRGELERASTAEERLPRPG